MSIRVQIDYRHSIETFIIKIFAGDRIIIANHILLVHKRYNDHLDRD